MNINKTYKFRSPECLVLSVYILLCESYRGMNGPLSVASNMNFANLCILGQLVDTSCSEIGVVSNTYCYSNNNI